MVAIVNRASTNDFSVSSEKDNAKLQVLLSWHFKGREKWTLAHQACVAKDTAVVRYRACGIDT
jgi:hypothetical protein